ncbi:hypothetical protein IJT10_02670, partial [bacterium]|nr:hypothetical protein [bacterium]
YWNTRVLILDVPEVNIAQREKLIESSIRFTQNLRMPFPGDQNGEHIRIQYGKYKSVFRPSSD